MARNVTELTLSSQWSHYRNASQGWDGIKLIETALPDGAVLVEVTGAALLDTSKSWDQTIAYLPVGKRPAQKVLGDRVNILTDGQVVIVLPLDQPGYNSISFRASFTR